MTEFDGCCDKRLGNGCTCPCHERQIRRAFLAGAERQSRQVRGRGLRDDELRRVIERFPLPNKGVDGNR